MVNPDQPIPQPALVTLSEVVSFLSPEIVSGKPCSIFLPISICTPSIACRTAYLASLYLLALKAVSAEARLSFTLGGVEINPSPLLLAGFPLLPTDDMSGVPEFALLPLELVPTASSIFLSIILSLVCCALSLIFLRIPWLCAAGSINIATAQHVNILCSISI